MSIIRKRLAQIDSIISVPGEHSPYINDDIVPLPPHRRTWTTTTFNFFWLATCVNLGGLAGSASVLSLGLTVYQAVITEVIGAVIIGCAVVLNGSVGGKWHIPFVVGNRAPWGVRGAWFVVGNRLIPAFCWYGVQTWWGGQVLKNMIGAIWPQFYTMKNHFAAGSVMKTNDFVCFILFWTLALPILAIRPERYRIPAMVSSIYCTTAVVALLIWALAKQGGGGPLLYDTVKTTGVPKLKGSKLAWTMARSVTTTVGGWSAAIMYQSDFTRYARRPGDQLYGQVFVIPIAMLITSFLGVIITSCAAGFYPDDGLLWKPYKLMEVIQHRADNSPGSRAAVFFLALSFFLSQLCVNVAGNAITGGIDLASMFPKYINTARGPYVVAVVGIAMCPWQLIYTANSFIVLVGSYSILLGPLAGIMTTDYFIIRRQNLRLTHLYTPNKSSDYWFWHGINPRAFLVYALALFPSLPGLVNNVRHATSNGPLVVSIGWVHTSYLAWPLGFAIASVGWVVINKVFPPPGAGETDETDFFGTFDVVEGEGSEAEKGSVGEVARVVAGLGKTEVKTGGEGEEEGDEKKR